MIVSMLKTDPLPTAQQPGEFDEFWLESSLFPQEAEQQEVSVF